MVKVTPHDELKSLISFFFTFLLIHIKGEILVKIYCLHLMSNFRSLSHVTGDMSSKSKGSKKNTSPFCATLQLFQSDWFTVEVITVAGYDKHNKWGGEP